MSIQSAGAQVNPRAAALQAAKDMIREHPRVAQVPADVLQIGLHSELSVDQLPTGQALQDDAPTVAANEPTGHGLQVAADLADLEALKVPLGHFVSLVDPALQYVPAEHGLQAVIDAAPMVLENEPAGQGVVCELYKGQ